MCPEPSIYASTLLPPILQDKGHVDLAERLPKNVGAAIGVELRDNTQTLSATNDKVVKAGMTFNVAVGKCLMGQSVCKSVNFKQIQVAHYRLWPIDGFLQITMLSALYRHR